MNPVNGGPDPENLNLTHFKPVKPWITRDQTCMGTYILPHIQARRKDGSMHKVQSEFLCIWPPFSLA